MSQIALLPVAYTVGTDFKPAARGPVEDITYWDEWGATISSRPRDATRLLVAGLSFTGE